MLKNFIRTDERCATFDYEVVIENRVLVGFSKESIWYVIGGREREASIGDDKFNGIEYIFNRRRPLRSAAGAVAFVRGEAGRCAGLVSPIRWRRAWESSGVMCPSISSAV